MDAPLRRSPFNQPLTYRALRTLALALGWREDKNQGKGSHRVFTRKGYRNMTLPCHGENHEYQRSVTREYLKQILEPLNDVCLVPVEGVHTVPQLEQVLADLIDYMPRQVQAEYERAIAEAKLDAQQYHQAQKAQIDQQLEHYEQQCLQECEEVVAQLRSEQSQLEPEGWDVLWVAYLDHLRQHKIVLTQVQDTVETMAQMQTQLEMQRSQYQTLEQQTLDTEAELTQQRQNYQQLQQTLAAKYQQVKDLQRLRRRDRLWIGLLGAFAVGIGLFVIYREVSPSPQRTDEQQSFSGITSDWKEMKPC